MTLDLPSHIGSYRIVKRLGVGGMGEVFLARDDRLRRNVAIKRALRSHFSDIEAGRRLLMEARAAAQLDHPRICPIFEVGEDDGLPFIVMPVVEGQTLQTRLLKGPLAIREAVDLATQIADALIAAHARGILHRDIKPANLIINERGEIRVMDFGLARLADDAASSGESETRGMTAIGTTVGTPSYMSPEQTRGQAVDARTDLFSLGVVLYEMVSGRCPFEGPSIAEVVTATLTHEPASLVRQRPEVPDELQRIVMKLLRKSAAERYQSAADLLVDLRALLNVAHTGATAAAPRRRSRALMAAIVVTVSLVSGAATFIFSWRASRPKGFNEAVDSLVVLPIVNDTGHQEQEFLADALTDSLIRNLSHVPSLKVMGRQTAIQFKNKALTPQQIGQALPVRAVMTGRLRRAGDQIVIDVELSDTRDGAVIVSRQYLQPAAQAARIEADISGDLVRELKVKTAGLDERRLAHISTTNGDAYQLHMRARFYQLRDSPAGYHEALTLNKQAIALDPNYAVAWFDIAEAAFQLGSYFESARQWMPESKIAALQALRVDPDIAGAHTMLGLVALVYDWDQAAAMRELAPLGQVETDAISFFTCSAHLLEGLNKPGDADRAIQRAMSVNPLSGPVRTEAGCNAYYEHRYPAAVEGSKAALEIDPRNVVALWNLARAYGQLGKHDETLAALAKVDDPPPIVIAERGYALARSGKTSEARGVIDALNRLSSTTYVDPYFIAEVYAGLGERAGALTALEAAFRDKSGMLVSISSEPKWDFIRKSPAFLDLQKRVGL